MHRLHGEVVRYRIAALALFGVLVLSTAACKERTESGGSVVDRDVNAVMESHVEALMATPGVTGVAIGALDDGTPCILVLILKDSDEIKARIPATIEGHPVQTLVSGEIKPMQGDTGG